MPVSKPAGTAPVRNYGGQAVALQQPTGGAAANGAAAPVTRKRRVIVSGAETLRRAATGAWDAHADKVLMEAYKKSPDVNPKMYVHAARLPALLLLLPSLVGSLAPLPLPACSNACRKAVQMVLEGDCSSLPRLDMYKSGMLERNGLKRLRKGTREARKLESIDTIVGCFDCCGNDCCSKRAVAAALSGAFLKADGNTHAENEVLLDYLWVLSEGQLSSLCNVFFAAVCGVGEHRLARLRRIIKVYGGEMQPHGNAGNTPVNVMSGAVAKKLSDVIDLYTRTNPSSNTLECVNENYLGVSGLMRAMRAEEPAAASSISLSSQRRLVERILTSRGLRALINSRPDHNVCELCKVI